ncbi:MAG: hypothetical protein ABSF46_13745, partial [Terriglobia bacterium]
PSGAVNINATFRPTAHAVGYFLAPLRGFRSPGALSKRLWGLALPSSQQQAEMRGRQAVPLREQHQD